MKSKLFFIIHPECEELKEWIKNVAKRMRKKKIKKGKNIEKTIATSEKNRFSLLPNILILKYYGQ